MNLAEVRPGDTLRVGLVVSNPGPARPVDVYFGVLANGQVRPGDVLAATQRAVLTRP